MSSEVVFWFAHARPVSLPERLARSRAFCQPSSNDPDLSLGTLPLYFGKSARGTRLVIVRCCWYCYVKKLRCDFTLECSPFEVSSSCSLYQTCKQVRNFRDRNMKTFVVTLRWLRRVDTFPRSSRAHAKGRWHDTCHLLWLVLIDWLLMIWISMMFYYKLGVCMKVYEITCNFLESFELRFWVSCFLCTVSDRVLWEQLTLCLMFTLRSKAILSHCSESSCWNSSLHASEFHLDGSGKMILDNRRVDGSKW